MEQNNLLNDVSDYQYDVPANTGDRLANYFIDLIAFVGLYVGVSFVLISTDFISVDEVEEDEWVTTLLIWVVYFGYYVLLEGSNRGKTVGKMVSKTRVVTLDGNPIDYGTAFVRTLIRLIPFEFLSAFSGGQMWHDKWTKTKLIKA